MHSCILDDKICSRMRVAFLVFNPVGPNGPAALIRKQGERNALTLREVLQYLHGIVTDTNHLHSGRFNSRQIMLQLHQLRLADRSPVRGTKKDEGHVTFLEQAGECALLAVLIAELKSRGVITNADALRRRGI